MSSSLVCVSILRRGSRKGKSPGVVDVVSSDRGDAAASERGMAAPRGSVPPTLPGGGSINGGGMPCGGGCIMNGWRGRDAYI